jgi:hypothetical protein
MSEAPRPAELASLHRDSRDRVIEIARSLDASQTSTRVPGTPLWNVRQLMAHIVGCPVALAAGEFEGAGSEAWTQAQVDARRDATIDDLVAELQGATAAIDDSFLAGKLPSPTVFDLVTHEQDLRGAIGTTPVPDPLAIRFVVNGFSQRATAVCAKAGLPPLRLLDPDSGWSAGAEGGIVGQASEFEWSRVLAGRRSNTQASALTWSGDPAPYLDLLCPFGALPVSDVHD